MHSPTEAPRTHDCRSPTPPLETALVAVTSLHLCFLPWALGTMHPWSQLCSLGFSTAGLTLALLLRPCSGGQTPAPRDGPVRQLVRSPLFWICLLVPLYLTIQALNPSWRYARNEAFWWMEPVDHVAWLPSGMEVPFQTAGPWRALVVAVSLLFFLASVKIGLPQRKSLRLLLLVLSLNALLLAGLGLLEQISGTKKIFWHYSPSNSQFVASFIYRNHAGAYFDLMIAATAALVFLYQRRAEHHRQKSSPAALFGLIAVILAVEVFVSRSRGSMAVLVAFALLLGASSVRPLPTASARHSSPLGRWALLLLFAAFAAVVLLSVGTEKIWRRFRDPWDNPVASMRIRATYRTAGYEMFSDRPLLGWGAGCFRFGFPLYAQKYPALSPSASEPLYIEHVHDDLLEFPIELGLLGLLPVVALLACTGRELVRRRFWESRLSLLLAGACCLTLIHSSMDFLFQNPAVLFTWALLLLIAVRWAQTRPRLPSPQARTRSAASPLTEESP